MPDSKKILHITSEINDSRVAQLLLPLLESSKARAHQVLYISKVRPLKKHPNFHWLASSSWYDPRWLLQLIEMIEKINPKIVHLHGIELLPKVVPAIQKGKLKCVVSILRSKAKNRLEKTKETVYRQALHWVDCVTVSNHVMAEGLLLEGFSAKRLHLLSNASAKIDYSFRQEIADKIENKWPDYKERHLFLCIPSPGTPNSKTWLRAMSRLEKKPHILISTQDYKNYREEIDKRKLKENFLVTRDLSDVFYFADLGLFPTGPKDVSQWIYQLFHHGKAFLGPYQGVLPDLVLHEHNGLLAQKSYYDWIRCFQYLDSDWVRVQAMKKASRSIGQQKYSPVRWLQNAEKIYKNLL